MLAIASAGFPLDGPYQILWSKSPISDPGTYTLVAEGEVAKGSAQATAIFTVPEAAYGTNYIQFRRGRRPQKDPYNFIFSVLPGIKVTPQPASVGSEVTIKGTGFPANKDDIKISFDGKDTTLSISTNNIGSFETTFTIPNTIAGKHEFNVTVENMSLGDIIASIQIQPNITLDPQHPEVGSEVTMTGSGFAATSQVSIKFNNIVIADSPKTDQTGNFIHRFKVPESSQDKQVVTATDKSGNVATSGLLLEKDPPPSPTPIFPTTVQRFGWFGSQTVNFSWSEVSDASGVTYTLEIGENIKMWPPIAIRSNLKETNCAVLLHPGTYYWRVKAVDGAGNESQWELSPYPFRVGLFSSWYISIGGLLFLFLFILLVRAFFRRLREYF